jgi:hypothetical protein
MPALKNFLFVTGGRKISKRDHKNQLNQVVCLNLVVNAVTVWNKNLRDYIHFRKYFHRGKGLGMGTGHQTVCPGLVAKLLQQERRVIF